MHSVIHTECACLHGEGSNSTMCLKRWFNVNNYTIQGIQVGICNEYLKLKAMESKIRINKFDIQDTAFEIFEKYLPFKITNNTKSGIFKYVTFCERPYIFKMVNIQDLYSGLLNELQNQNNSEVCYKIRQEIVSFLNYHITRKDYKKYDIIRRLVKRLDNSMNDEFDNVFNDVIIELFRLKILNK